MFYSGSIIKGPLQVVWLAAHSDRRMKRQQALGTSIPDTVDKMLHGMSAPTSRAGPSLGSTATDAVPLALRLSGQLLLGVVRVYKDQVVYLAEDAEGALCNLQVHGMARVPVLTAAAGAVDNAAGQAGVRAAAHPAAADIGAAAATVPAGGAAAVRQQAAASKPAAAGAGAHSGRLMSRLQQHADIEQLVATLGGIDEEEAFLTRAGSGAALLDWTTDTTKVTGGNTLGKQLSGPTSPHPMLQVPSAPGGPPGSGRHALATLPHGSSLLLSRASMELQAASGLRSAGRRGSDSGFSPIVEDEEVFDEVAPLPLDFDQQDDVWLLSTYEQAVLVSPSSSGEDGGEPSAGRAVGDGGPAGRRQQVLQTVSEGEEVGEEVGEEDGQEQGGGGGEWEEGDRPGRMEVEYGSPEQDNRPANDTAEQEDSDVTEWHDAEAGGLEGQVDTAGRQHEPDMGAERVQARLQQQLGLHVVKGDRVLSLIERHVSGLPATTLPTSAVRALIDDRQALLHPDKQLAWASAEAASGTQAVRHAQAVQLRDVLLQAAVQQQDPAMAAALQQSTAGLNTSSAGYCVRQNQLLQSSMRHAAELPQCVVLGPVQPTAPVLRAPVLPPKTPTGRAGNKKDLASKFTPVKDSAHTSNSVGHQAARDGYARHWLSQQLAPYLLAAFKADDGQAINPNADTSNPQLSRDKQDRSTSVDTAVPLARWLTACGLMSMCPGSLTADLRQLLGARQFSGQQQAYPLQKDKAAAGQQRAETQPVRGRKPKQDQAGVSGGDDEAAGAASDGPIAGGRKTKPAQLDTHQQQQSSENDLTAGQQGAAEQDTIPPDTSAMVSHEGVMDTTARDAAKDDDMDADMDEGLLPAGDGEVLLTEEEEEEAGDGRLQGLGQEGVQEDGMEDVVDEGAGQEAGPAHVGVAGLPMATDGFTARTRNLLTQLHTVIERRLQQASQMPGSEEDTPSKRMRLQAGLPASSSQVLASPVSVATDVVPPVLASTAKARGPGAAKRAATARIQCARMFVDLLVLQNRGYVNLQQQKAYQDIQVIPRDKMHAALVSPSPVMAAEAELHHQAPKTPATTAAAAGGSSKKTAVSMSKATPRKRLFTQQE